jgi:outer membrane murein-binding lipoprotein Lpp
MIVATAAQDIAIVIGAIAAGVAVVAGAVFSGIAAMRSTQAHNEVRTLNTKTIGVLAGEDETRRIVQKDPLDRTFSDQQHLQDVPPEDQSS